MLIAALTARAAEWPGVIHVHTRLSHDSTGTFTEIAEAARTAGARFVILTDHPGKGVPEDQPRGMVDGVLFIRGIEDDHLLALGVDRPLIAPTLAGRVREIHAQGGLAFVTHPEGFDRWDLDGLDGTEIYNIHSDVRDEWKVLLIPGWLLRLWRGPLAAMTAFLDYPAHTLARWDARAARGRFAGLAANDAHRNVGVGRWTLDPYHRQFRFVRTVVTAPRLDQPSILEGLRRGRSRVEFTVLGDPGPIVFESYGTGLRVRTPPGATVRLLRDGTEIWKRPAPPDGRLWEPRPAPGAWRVEVWSRLGRREFPWVLTNHLRVATGR